MCAKLPGHTHSLSPLPSGIDWCCPSLGGPFENHSVEPAAGWATCSRDDGRLAIAFPDLLPYLLGNFETVEEVVQFMDPTKVQVWGKKLVLCCATPHSIVLMVRCAVRAVGRNLVASVQRRHASEAVCIAGGMADGVLPGPHLTLPTMWYCPWHAKPHHSLRCSQPAWPHSRHSQPHGNYCPLPNTAVSATHWVQVTTYFGDESIEALLTVAGLEWGVMPLHISLMDATGDAALIQFVPEDVSDEASPPPPSPVHSVDSFRGQLCPGGAWPCMALCHFLPLFLACIGTTGHCKQSCSVLQACTYMHLFN